jgi:membrane-associated phospholipid phosphatase
LAYALGGLVLTIALGLLLRDNSAGTQLDRWFQRVTKSISAQPGHPGFHYRSYWALTRALQWGDLPGILLVCTAGALVVATATGRARRRWANIAVPYLALLVSSATAELLLKHVIDRHIVGNLSVQTYPSGHSVGTAAVAGSVIAVLAWRDGTGWSGWELRRWRWTAGAVFMLISLVVGLSMAILRAHFLTDVIGGWVWGASWGVLIAVALRTRSRAVR